MPDRLDGAARADAFPALAAAGWGGVAGRDAIRKVYRFADFSEAFGFMTRAAMVAEKLDHHPEWSNVYRTVDVVLTTHDAGGLSMLDLKAAQAFDALAAGAEAAPAETPLPA